MLHTPGKLPKFQQLDKMAKRGRGPQVMRRGISLGIVLCLIGCGYFQRETKPPPLPFEENLQSINGFDRAQERINVVPNQKLLTEPRQVSLRLHGPPKQSKYDPLLAVYVFDQFGNCVARDDLPMHAYSRDSGEVQGFFADQVVATWTAVPGMSYHREIRNHSSEPAEYNLVQRTTVREPQP
jgi:hypothetical protein